ncbi:MAG: FkbM family methyltransferase [Rhodothermaceae bacterium]|nr:FkbM family methyltransferase [Rhodothermaceae bacterium]
MFARLAARLLPPPALRFIGRLQYRVPVLGPLIRRAAGRVATGEGVIRYGVGTGLRFQGDGAVAGYLLGTSEPELQEAFAERIRPGDTVYDLGANIGFYMILAARLVGPTGRVVAFEPFPATAAAARHNARLNAFDQVHVIEAAVADRPGEEWLMTGTGPVTFRLGEDREQPGQLVPVISVDAFVSTAEEPPPDFVKIDVEGAEERVLLGMKDTLRQHRPTVLCEVHYAISDFAGFVARELGPLGYTATRIDGDGIPEAGARFHVVLTPLSEPITSTT